MQDLSDIRNYLAEKAARPNEYLSRRPRETHPGILRFVREATADHQFSYDSDVELYVAERITGLPPYRHHGHPDRDLLIQQLGHECYIAKCILRDEAALEEVVALGAEGYVSNEDFEVVDGGRYLVRFGTIYVGQKIPSFGEPHEVRARKRGGRVVFLPKGARTRGFVERTPMLVKAIDA